MTSVNTWKLIYTAVIHLNQLSYGLNIPLGGLTQIDLSYVYNVSYSTITTNGTMNGIGYLLGSLVAWSYHRLNRQLILIILLIVQAGTMLFTPYLVYVPLLFVASVLNGFGSGAWDSSWAAWLIEMWPDYSSTLMQSCQLMFGLGTALAPLIAAPYLHPPNDLTTNYTMSGSQRQRAITVPYTVVSLAIAFTASLLAILYFIKPYRIEEYQDTQMKNKEETSTDDRLQEDKDNESTNVIKHRMVKLVLLAICLSAYGNGELTWFNFFTSMIEFMHIGFDASSATYLLACMSATFTVGRLINAFIALKIKSDYVLSYHFVIILGAALLLLFGIYHPEQNWILYVGCTTMGFGLSAMWPGILAFTNRHVSLTPRVGSVFSFVFGICSMLTPVIVGSHLREFPILLFTFETGFIGISFIAFLLVNFFIYFITNIHRNTKLSNSTP